jgi:hypothetical protein
MNVAINYVKVCPVAFLKIEGPGVKEIKCTPQTSNREQLL